jgi:hypothetical protein
MADDRTRRGKSDFKRDLWLAAMLVAAGLVTSGLSLVEIGARDAQELAQGTPRLQGAPPADSNAPAEAKPGGTRPTTPAPEPARPDVEAQKDSAKPALPPAPPEKVAPPIKDK